MPGVMACRSRIEMNKEVENDRRRAMEPDDGVDGFFFILLRVKIAKII